MSLSIYDRPHERFELFEDGEDTGMLLVMSAVERAAFHADAEKAGHHEILIPLDQVVSVELVPDPEN